jgi:hypothetical protein
MDSLFIKIGHVTSFLYTDYIEELPPSIMGSIDYVDLYSGLSLIIRGVLALNGSQRRSFVTM